MKEDQSGESSTAPEWRSNPFGDRYCATFAGGIFETTRAAELFQRRFGQELFHEETLYVITGSDSGLLPRYIIGHGLPKGSRYLFVELEGMKRPVADGVIPAALADRIAISDQESWAAQARELALANYAYSGRISYVRSISVQQNSHPLYAALHQDVSRELMHLYWLFSAQFDEHVFTKNQLANLAENRIPAIRLRDRFKGNSAVILAAGPSLDELLPWIAAHRHELLLIAVSRIAARLLQAGLEPDMIVSVDPQFISFSVSKEMLQLGERTLFVHSSSATPLLVGAWPHHAVFTGARVPWHDPGFDNLGTIAPTVTNNAILLAQDLGCSQIILAGVDLCYSAAGYTHASGTKEHAAGPMLGQIDQTVETNSGQKAETNTGYYEAINTIERQALQAAEHGCQLVNPAGGAARMKGVEYIPTARLTIAKPLQNPAWETIRSVLDDGSAAARRAHYRQAQALLEKALKESRTIRALASEALECSHKMEKRVNSSRYAPLKNRMDRIERILGQRYEAMSSAIKRNNANDFAKVISADTGAEWSAAELFHKTGLYYQAFIDGADTFATLIDASLSRILSRIEEESAAPRLELLFRQWAQDLQFGRGEIWKRRHPQHYAGLTPEQQHSFTQLAQQFSAMLRSDDANLTHYFQNLAANENTIGALIGNARNGFDQNSPETLQRILDGLQQRKEPLAQQAALLVQGFLHELAQQPQAASGCYEAIDAAISAELWQISQEHLLSSSMAREDYSGALAALQRLAARIISYQPLHAQLLALTGDASRAIEVYTKYLQQQPRDLNTTLALGLLLAEIGARDAARSALDHIRDLDPAHPAVQTLGDRLEQLWP